MRAAHRLSDGRRAGYRPDTGESGVDTRSSDSRLSPAIAGRTREERSCTHESAPNPYPHAGALLAMSVRPSPLSPSREVSWPASLVGLRTRWHRKYAGTLLVRTAPHRLTASKSRSAVTGPSSTAAHLARPAATGDSTEQTLALQPRDAVQRRLFGRGPLTQQRARGPQHRAGGGNGQERERVQPQHPSMFGVQ